jgi:imidazolonepropionase-like amidohydrolase
MNQALLLVLALCGLAAAQSRVTVFTGGRVIDGTGKAAIERGSILVQDERVLEVGPADRVRVPSGAVRVDTTGKTVVPGFINAHGHAGETVGLRSGPELYSEENVLRQLALYARYGVTTVLSLGGDHEAGFRLRDAQNSAGLNRARLFVAGPAISSAKSAADARDQVDKAVLAKPNFIKIRVDDNLGTGTKLAPEAWRAILERAHERKLPVAAHIFYLDDARALLEAGVDYIAHSIRDREVDAATVALLKKRDICVCPTLAREVSAFVYESRPAFFDDPFFLQEADREVLKQLSEPARQAAMRNNKSAQQYKVALEVASRNLKKLVDSGVRIAMGTDTGPPARFQGYFEHMEMDLMSKAGLTPMQILKSATGDAARCINQAGKVGTIEKGAWADLLVLSRNPLDDIRNARTIESVWIAGNRVSR